MKGLLLAVAVLYVSFCNAAQFDIPDGDIAALKAAILTSNTNNKPDTIHLAPFGMYKFTVSDNDFLFSGQNALPPLRLDGVDANDLVIFGNGATLMRDPSIDVLRLLYVVDVKVTICNLNFIGGTTLQFDNEAGAIMINSGKVTLENCLLKNNRATNGGAVYVVGRGSFTAKNCTFTGNVASAGTGSVFASTYGSSYFQNCVLAYNSCVNVNVPAAIYNFIPLNSNTALDNIFLKNCIVAKNTYDNPTSPDNGKEFDIAGAVYSDGGNVIGSYPVVMQVSYPTFRQGTPGAHNDYVGTETVYVDPVLGTFGDHGLFTEFYPVRAGSPALLNGAGIKNAGLPAIASNGIVPSAAYAGDIITMTGINLAAINKVQFAGAPATTTGITTTNRTVTVPVHANATSGIILLMDPAPHFVFTTQKFKVKTVTTPAAPSNLAGTPTGSSSVTLTWNDVATEDNYRIEYKKSADNTYGTAATVNANMITYAVENLLCTDTYDFRVIALGRGTQSAPSNVVQVTPSPLQPPVLTPPSSTEGCTGETISIAAPAGFAGYTWSSGETTQTIGIETAGDYSVKVTDTGGCVSVFSSPVTITFTEPPATTGNITGNALVQGGSTDNTYSVSDPGNVTFDWSYDGTGATLTESNNAVSIDFTAGATSGTLSATISNACGSVVGATLPLVVETVTAGEENEFSKSISVSPNPSTGKFTVRVPASTGSYHMTITDTKGKIIYRNSGRGDTRIELPDAKAGMYLLLIEADHKKVTKKIMITEQ